MRHALLLLVLLWATAATAAERPTRADLQRALALHERSVVTVKGGRGTGPGIIVGGEGQVLTAVGHVNLEGAQVEYERQVLPATVLLADAALKVAVVAAPAGTYPAVPVQVAAGSPEGQWLIGVVRGPGRRQTPMSAQARSGAGPFIDVDLVLPPGSPLFDTRGRLVAVAVQRHGRGCRALPLEVVKQRLAPRVASP
ncbi:serine protease [Archangium primigenium]|nr:trypsin-like peptidase domain-containing protein [Archangium primigenium]MBM7115168.1 serine protease [Archangium primigenium]